MTESGNHRCGLVAIVGRPNVGKSTLLNALIGFRLSIVSPRPQTTRHRILGISTTDDCQIVYVDTPGLHSRAKRAMNRSLNRSVGAALLEVDLAVHVIEGGRWRDEDQAVYAAIREQDLPALLVLNKTDLTPDKERFLPFVHGLADDHDYADIFYVSARKRQGLEALQQGIAGYLPRQPSMFGEDEITDRSERFMIGEMIREQLMRRLSRELPYSTTVVVERFAEREDGVTEVDAVIWVERKSQKAIVIGHGGQQLKAIGTAARRVMERTLERRVFLSLWVKVREGWADDASALQQFGYTD